MPINLGPTNYNDFLASLNIPEGTDDPLVKEYIRRQQVKSMASHQPRGPVEPPVDTRLNTYPGMGNAQTRERLNSPNPVAADITTFAGNAAKNLAVDVPRGLVHMATNPGETNRTLPNMLANDYSRLLEGADLDAIKNLKPQDPNWIFKVSKHFIDGLEGYLSPEEEAEVRKYLDRSVSGKMLLQDPGISSMLMAGAGKGLAGNPMAGKAPTPQVLPRSGMDRGFLEHKPVERPPIEAEFSRLYQKAPVDEESLAASGAKRFIIRDSEGRSKIIDDPQMAKRIYDSWKIEDPATTIEPYDAPDAVGRQQTVSRTAKMLDDPKFTEKQPVAQWIQLLQHKQFPKDEPALLQTIAELKKAPLKQRMTKAEIQQMLNDRAPELETVIAKNPSYDRDELFVRDPNEYKPLDPEKMREIDLSILRMRDLQKQHSALEWEGFKRMGYNPEDYNHSLTDLFKDKGMEIWERTKNGEDRSHPESIGIIEKMGSINDQILQLEKKMEEKYGIDYTNRHEMYAIADKEKEIVSKWHALADEQKKLYNPDGTINRENHNRNQEINQEIRALDQQLNNIRERKRELGPQHRYDGHSWAKQPELSEPAGRVRFYNRVNEDGSKVLVIDNFQKPTEGSGQREKMPEHLNKRAHDLMTQSILNYAREKGYRDVEWTTGNEQNTRWDVDDREWDASKWELGPIHIRRGDKQITVDGWINDSVGTESQWATIWKTEDAHPEGKPITDNITREFYATMKEAQEAVDKRMQSGIVPGDLRPLYDKELPKLMEKHGQGSKVERGGLETENIDDIVDQLYDGLSRRDLEDIARDTGAWEDVPRIVPEIRKNRQSVRVEGQQPQPLIYSKSGLSEDTFVAPVSGARAEAEQRFRARKAKKR